MGKLKLFYLIHCQYGEVKIILLDQVFNLFYHDFFQFLRSDHFQ